MFGGEYVEGRERFVEEQYFGLYHEGAGESDALLHAPGEFLGECFLKPVEADEVDGLDRARPALAAGRSTASNPISTFCNTVSQGKSAKLWKTIATWELGPVQGAPCTSTSPSDGAMSPARIRRSVDLPDPEGPSSATNSPARSSRLTCSNAAARSLP